MDFNFEESNNIKIEKNVDNLIKSNDNLILKKKKLIEISKNLTKIEYLEIFNIIQEDKCIYSENKNGIFINLSNVSENTIDKIFNFINFIKHKKEDLLKYEEYVTIAKKNISDVQKSVINNNISNEKEYNDNNNYEYSDSEDDDDKKINEYLVFSSDEEDDLENKLSLKKKKIKYSGKKAKMIKSIKDSGNNNNKNKNKKSEE
jgi:hypothetical protein